MLKPSCETRCCIRATAIAKPPCTHCLQHAACGKRKPAPFRPRADTWGRRMTLGDGGLSVQKKAHCTFRPAGFCLRHKNRSFCPPVAKTSDSCLLTRYVVDLFNDFLLLGSHFSQKPHFYGLYLAKNRSSCPEAAKMNDSSQFTKENACFGHDRLQASFALCIAAHLGSYRSSNLNGAVEARWSLVAAAGHHLHGVRKSFHNAVPVFAGGLLAAREIHHQVRAALHA